VITVSKELASSIQNDDSVFVITGVRGWLGSAFLEVLAASLGGGISSRVALFGSRRGEIQQKSGVRLPIAPIQQLPELSLESAIVLHTAFLTKDRLKTVERKDFCDSNRSIRDQVQKFVSRNPIKGFFLPSSGAVYASDGGLVNSEVANPYGFLKVEDETTFADIPSLKDRLTIVRIFNLAGPFLNKPDDYVLGSIIRDVFDGGPVTLHADHPVIRSYVHVLDLVKLALMLTLGIVKNRSIAFDTAGTGEIEVSDLAQLCIDLFGNREMQVLRPDPLRMEGLDRYVGDGAMFLDLLQEAGIEAKSLRQQILDTADYMANP
jgi:UDP-glucuronate decarboxylase